jgi:hypothetical protein
MIYWSMKQRELGIEEVVTFPLPPSPQPSPPAGGRGSVLEPLAFDNGELSP